MAEAVVGRCPKSRKIAILAWFGASCDHLLRIGDLKVCSAPGRAALEPLFDQR
jgi:hypothetical protein